MGIMSVKFTKMLKKEQKQQMIFLCSLNWPEWKSIMFVIGELPSMFSGYTNSALTCTVIPR